jgi:3alpha(or 20beta)-hydroxysteroid dehydrogenase
MLLDGKVAIVTGAARGTGAMIARRFVAEGATVVVADIRGADAHALADELGPYANHHECDITDEAAWTRLVQETVQLHGRIDVLVNNAAILHMGGIEHTTLAEFRRVFDVNTAGAFLGTKAVAKIMRANGGGSIVNIASIDAMQGMNGLSAYTTSKWALRGLTKASAVELGRDNIRVNTVCPAGGNPAMYGPWAEKLARLGPEIAGYTKKRAMPREAHTDEIADVAVFLASDLSRMVSGVDIPVDGGHLAGDHVDGFNSL